MRQFYNIFQSVFTVAGGIIGWYLGGADGLIYALLVFIIADYITGVIAAFATKTLSSRVGFKGICKKVFILILVGIGNLIDLYVLKSGSGIRTAVIFFYLSNEGLSILENSVITGLPVPKFLKETLEKLKEKGEE